MIASPTTYAARFIVRRTKRAAPGDPTAAPFLRNDGGCATAAGRVKDEVAWIGCHQHTSLNDKLVGLNHINLAHVGSGLELREVLW